MKTGELLILSTDKYPDYTFSGPYRVLKDFTFAEIVAVVKSRPGTGWKSKAVPDDVVEYLKNEGYIEVVPCTEVHLGSYGDIDVMGAE